ncbi:MAG: crotonase/enoyl-CoA hydratase family protein [Myxococcota bacterium]
MQRVDYAQTNGIATIAMDDGKANAMSPAMLAELNAALDRAEKEAAVVVLTGRSGLFSAGFDLGVLRAGGDPALGMLRGGFELAERLLSFPIPTVAACGGHAIAMGAFLLLSCDVRIGSAGAHRLSANEVAIGLTMPLPAVAVLQYKLTPAAADRAIATAADFRPDEALAAGFLDQVVPPDALAAVCRETATRLASLHRDAHHASKLRARVSTLEALRAGVEADFPMASSA